MNIHKIKSETGFNKEENQGNVFSLRQNFIKIFEKFMILVGIIGQSLYFFQAFKIYTLGSARDVSTPGFSFALFSLICWLLYGFLIKNKVLIVVNVLAVIGASLTLLAIFLVS